MLYCRSNVKLIKHHLKINPPSVHQTHMTTSREKIHKCDTIGLCSLRTHLFKQLQGFNAATILRKSGYHCIPRNYISRRHPPKDAASITQTSTLCIHGRKSTSNRNFQAKTILNNPGMHLLSLI
ncbi:hypothetical protein V8G54_016626 [Vigna mungo]|uniref:Uncharacterized protein n=1 Tax=Vigna mungo TaxID=3915 RepID=A0AAQ3NNG6_VIGMU